MINIKRSFIVRIPSVREILKDPEKESKLPFRVYHGGNFLLKINYDYVSSVPEHPDVREEVSVSFCITSLTFTHVGKDYTIFHQLCDNIFCSEEKIEEEIRQSILTYYLDIYLSGMPVALNSDFLKRFGDISNAVSLLRYHDDAIRYVFERRSFDVLEPHKGFFYFFFLLLQSSFLEKLSLLFLDDKKNPYNFTDFHHEVMALNQKGDSAGLPLDHDQIVEKLKGIYFDVGISRIEKLSSMEMYHFIKRYAEKSSKETHKVSDFYQEFRLSVAFRVYKDLFRYLDILNEHFRIPSLDALRFGSSLAEDLEFSNRITGHFTSLRQYSAPLKSWFNGETKDLDPVVKRELQAFFVALSSEKI